LVETTLLPGSSILVSKTVQVPEVPPKADIYFLADTTGSMGTVIDAVQADASTVLDSIRATVPDAEFGAGTTRTSRTISMLSPTTLASAPTMASVAPSMPQTR
jgi:hypothetical protein